MGPGSGADSTTGASSAATGAATSEVTWGKTSA